MSVARYLLEENECHLVLEVGRLADMRPCNQVIAFLEAVKFGHLEFDEIDPNLCLVRRISYIARPEIVHYEAGPAFQVENAVTGEVYLSEYYFSGKRYDPNDSSDPNNPEHLRQAHGNNEGHAPEP